MEKILDLLCHRLIVRQSKNHEIKIDFRSKYLKIVEAGVSKLNQFHQKINSLDFDFFFFKINIR